MVGRPRTPFSPNPGADSLGQRTSSGGQGRIQSPAPGRRPLGAAPARTRLREGRGREAAPARGPGRAESGQEGPLLPTPAWVGVWKPPQPTGENGGSLGGQSAGASAEAEARLGVRVASGVGLAGHSRGQPGGSLRLCVVVVPVFSGRRLGCSLGPRRAGARPLRCLPARSCSRRQDPAAAAAAREDGGPRLRRRTAAALAHSFARLCGAAGCCLRVLPGSWSFRRTLRAGAASRTPRSRPGALL